MAESLDINEWIEDSLNSMTLNDTQLQNQNTIQLDSINPPTLRASPTPSDPSSSVHRASNLLDSSSKWSTKSQSSGSQDSRHHRSTAAFMDPTNAMNDATTQFQLDAGGIGTRNFGVAPASDFSYHTPEPPPFHVPPPENGIFAPTFDGLCGDDLTEADLRIITRTEFTPTDNTSLWTYQLRRKAQKILPFLYLGPWEVLKNHLDFVRDEEISMLLVVRDTATARAGIMSPKKYAEALGILYDSIDVQNNQELITAFPHAIKLINNHLVNCYRQQVLAAGANFVPGQTPLRIGKIFLFCESGNDRSAAIAVAYVLAMYKVSLLYSIQYVQAQRFCISIDEPIKHLLSAYEDILKAQRDVHISQRQINAAQEQLTQAPPNSQVVTNMPGIPSRPSNPARTKRGRDIDEDDMGDDEDRFRGRSAFQPFVQE